MHPRFSNITLNQLLATDTSESPSRRIFMIVVSQGGADNLMVRTAPSGKNEPRLCPSMLPRVFSFRPLPLSFGDRENAAYVVPASSLEISNTAPSGNRSPEAATSNKESEPMDDLVRPI